MSMLNEVQKGSQNVERDRTLSGRLKEIVPWKGDKPVEILRKLVYIVSVCVLIRWGFYSYSYFFGSKSMLNDQKDLADIYSSGVESENISETVQNPGPAQSDPAPSVPGDSLEGDTPAQDTPVPAPQPLSRFEKLLAMNPDTVGWLSIDGLYLQSDSDELAINYPVVQTTDNDYYLVHDFNGVEKEYGCLYADYKADLDYGKRSSIVTIYGHNMKVEAYFHHLRDYNRYDPGFVSDHRLVTFSSLYSEDKYIIFACFYVSTNEEDDDQPIFRYHNCVDFNSMADFDYWYKNVMYRNYYNTDIQCGMDDEYLVLSTCSFEINDARFVVVARKLHDGEDPSVYNYETNYDRHMPVKWYQAFGNTVPATDSGPDYEYYSPSES